jgi:hypothetical protein
MPSPVPWPIGPGLCEFLHLYPAPQHVDPRPPWWMRSGAILAAPRGDLCKILHPNFGEYLFHALG